MSSASRPSAVCLPSAAAFLCHIPIVCLNALCFYLPVSCLVYASWLQAVCKPSASLLFHLPAIFLYLPAICLPFACYLPICLPFLPLARDLPAICLTSDCHLPAIRLLSANHLPANCLKFACHLLHLHAISLRSAYYLPASCLISIKHLPVICMPSSIPSTIFTRL